MNKGWVKLHRSLIDTPLWLSEPFTRGQAWVDLFTLAQHEPSYFRIRGIKVDVDRGQLAYSQISLAERWKWSRGKVRRFMKELENQGNIIQQNGQITTVITICKYDIYQGSGTADDTADDTANGQQTDSKRDTYKNDKNDKNDKKKQITPSIEGLAQKFQKPTIEMVIEYALNSVRDLSETDCRAFFDYYTANGWRVGRSAMKDWHAALRNWARNKRQFGVKSSTTPPVQRGSGNVCPF